MPSIRSRVCVSNVADSSSSIACRRFISSCNGSAMRAKACSSAARRFDQPRDRPMGLRLHVVEAAVIGTRFHLALDQRQHGLGRTFRPSFGNPLEPSFTGQKVSRA
jgi:hypothetical protein